MGMFDSLLSENAKVLEAKAAAEKAARADAMSEDLRKRKDSLEALQRIRNDVLESIREIRGRNYQVHDETNLDDHGDGVQVGFTFSANKRFAPGAQPLNDSSITFASHRDGTQIVMKWRTILEGGDPKEDSRAYALADVGPEIARKHLLDFLQAVVIAHKLKD